MSLFNSDSKSSTKMFINLPHLAPTSEPTRNISKMIPAGAGVIIDLVANAAPKLIEEGLELLSSTINKFAQQDVTKTIVKRNIDILDETKISIPSNITLIRGDFAEKITGSKGIPFGDNGKHQATFLGEEKDRDLHIEIDIKKSKDEKSICFQPTKYFYNGVDREQDTIDEIVLGIAFVPVDKSVVNVDSFTFQTFLHFENLTAHTQYEFGSEVNGYDANYQSSWMQPAIDPKVPYTLVIEIQEIREGNSFAKLLQTVYTENKSYIKEELNAKIKLLEALKPEEKTPPEKPTVTKPL
ncbi:hypothetical protein KKC13_09795 [bacterium]|nr:hypothetical protein [bacterium]MBU1958072.1 hypothetical protein [bacterium]